jgi:hypothetical protein
MANRYILHAYGDNFLVAGSQGLSITLLDAFTDAPSGASYQIDRVSSVVGGTASTIVSLDDPAPTPLAALLGSPTSFATVGNLVYAGLVAPANGVALVKGPIKVAAGNGLRFQVSGPGSTFVSVYFEE